MAATIGDTSFFMHFVAGRSRAALFGILIGAGALCAPAYAAPGDLDPAFNGNGMVTTTIGPINTNDSVGGTVVQADGKIVVAGSSWTGSRYLFTLARYNIGGSLDASFGSGGIVTTEALPGAALAVVLQPDGKIVAGGYCGCASTNVFALARYQPDGSLDPSFGAGGVALTALGAFGDQVNGLALKGNGKVVAAGYSGISDTASSFAVAQYNPNGSLDTSFNGTGYAVTPAVGFTSMAAAVVAQDDGKIVAIGWGELTAGEPVVGLVRYNLNGTLDTSFNTTGIVTTSYGANISQAWAGALQPDGKIIAGGSAWIGAQNVFALARYNPDGILDASFHTTGIATTPIGTDDRVNSVRVQPDGKILLGGSTRVAPASSRVFALARYNANGSLDTGFGSGAKLTAPIGSIADSVASLALQSDGKIVAAGVSAYGPSRNIFAVARFLGDAPNDAPIPVPALSSAGILASALLLGAVALLKIRRRAD